MNHIDEIREWWSGYDESGRDISADFMIMGLFDNSAAVARYLEHPHHQLGVEAWRAIADWVVVDISEDAKSHQGGDRVHAL